MDGGLAPEAPAPGPGPAVCTTGLARDGRLHLLRRHQARLRRDAPRAGLEPPDPERVADAVRALAPGRARIVRIEVRGGSGPRLVAVARPLSREGPQWRALALPHPGPGPVPGAKRPRHPALERALERAARLGCQEALLFDDRGRLVEGARSAVVVRTAAGTLVTPPAGLGGVRSLALDVLRETWRELGEADLDLADLLAAREVIAVNAVRGARSVVEIRPHRLRLPAGAPLRAAAARILARAG